MQQNGEQQQKEEGKRGRPLDLSLNKAILEATLDLLAQQGFDALTIEAIAQRAKVGKATIYRRWCSKVELVIDAASFMSPYETLLEQLDKSKGLREQLIDLLSITFQNEHETHQQAMAQIGSALTNHSDLEQGLHNHFNSLHRSAMEAVISPFLKEGHQLATKDLDLLSDVGPALMMYRAWIIRKPFDRSYIERIVDRLMMPLLEEWI